MSRRQPGGAMRRRKGPQCHTHGPPTLTTTLPVTRASPTSPPSVRGTGQWLRAATMKTSTNITKRSCKELPILNWTNKENLFTGARPLGLKKSQWPVSVLCSLLQFQWCHVRRLQPLLQETVHPDPALEVFLSPACKKPECLCRRSSSPLVLKLPYQFCPFSSLMTDIMINCWVICIFFCCFRPGDTRHQQHDRCPGQNHRWTEHPYHPRDQRYKLLGLWISLWYLVTTDMCSYFCFLSLPVCFRDIHQDVWWTHFCCQGS